MLVGGKNIAQVTVSSLALKHSRESILIFLSGALVAFVEADAVLGDRTLLEG
jgi:hypothetical protein